MKKRLPGFMICFLAISGLLIMAYPTISNWQNQKYQMNAIVDYQENVDNMKKEKIQRQREEAEKYNAALTGMDIEDPFIPGSGIVLPENYTSILDISDGIMGYIEIPVVDIRLPIYHGTSEEVLEKGVGHMEMTALPIGGKGNHTVLTGHTALPNALLFTNLRDMESGDEFYISILDKVLAYKVDQILIVEPDNTSALKPVADEDYVTLITCTPYAVNSHRLLVRGTRIPYIPDKESGGGRPAETKWSYNLIVFVIMLSCVSVVAAVSVHRRIRGRTGGKR